jgi:hypothetical protein
MSEAAAHPVHVTDNDAWEATLSRVQFPALVIGGVGLLLTLIGLFVDTSDTLRSYLWAFLYWAMIPLGSLAFLMIQHMTGGTWGLLGRRFFEASASLIVLFAVLAIPVLIAVASGNYHVYPWLGTDGEGHRVLGHAANPAHLEFKALWLSKGFFIFRTIFYFGLWTFLAYYLYAWSGREDRSGSTPKTRFAARRVAAPGILFGALAINFAMLDWIMTLDPSWYSTMFGVLYIVGCGLMAMSFTVFVLRMIADRRPIRDVISPGVLNDMGNLMFAFTLLWAYTNFSQFLIIWSGNIAEETPYYYVRTKGSWAPIALIVVIFHFFVPFLLLLWRKIKRDVRLLAMVALGIMVMRGVDLFWIVKPMFLQTQITLGLDEHGNPPGHGGGGAHGDVKNTNQRPEHQGTAEGGHGAPAPAATTPATQPSAAARPIDTHVVPGGADPAKESGDHASAAATTAPKSGDEHRDVATVKGESHQVPVKGLSHGIHWTDIPAFAGIGGLWVWAFVWRLKRRPLIPPNDPRLVALAHGGHH